MNEPVAAVLDVGSLTAAELARAEQALTTFEIFSTLRHDLRNKLAPMRNVVAYLSRKMEPTELWQDPRVPRFLGLMESEIGAANDLLDAPPHLDRLLVRQAGPIPVEAAVQRAVELVGESEKSLTTACDSAALVEADPRELVLAIAKVLENALEYARTAVTIRVVHQDQAVAITIEDDGEGFPLDMWSAIQQGIPPVAPGRVGLGLRLALRAARRAGGNLEPGSESAATVVSLVLPIAEGHR